MVIGRAQLGISPRLLNVVVLRRYRTNMPFFVKGFFLRCRPRFDSAATAVIAHAVHVYVFDPGVIRVVNNRRVYVVDVGVVVEMVVFPASAIISMTEVTKSIVNSAVNPICGPQYPACQKNADPPQPQ